MTLATLGQGDIHLQDPEASDDPSGLNRNTTRTERELYRIEQQRQIDLTVDHRLLSEAGRAAIREQIATLPDTVKETYDEVATQVTLLTHPAPDAAVAAGGSITEDLYEALLRRGFSVEDATAILESEDFQRGVLVQLPAIDEAYQQYVMAVEQFGLSPEEALRTRVPADPAVSEGPLVTAEIVPPAVAEQGIVALSDINAYLEEHPEQQRIVEIGLAVAQGPKGVIGLLVDEALANTPLGEEIAERIYDAGKYVAEWALEKDLDGTTTGGRYYIGGGILAAGIVSGGITPGGKKGGGEHAGGHAAGDSPYSGGPHRETSQPVGDGFDSHHCPAKNCYNNAPISSADGPAIQIDPRDHRLTSSYGNSPEAKAYREEQRMLVDEGRVQEAIQMDIDDIRRIENEIGQPGKYDNAIRQMQEYANTLNPDKFINQ